MKSPTHNEYSKKCLLLLTKCGLFEKIHKINKPLDSPRIKEREKEKEQH